MKKNVRQYMESLLVLALMAGLGIGAFQISNHQRIMEALDDNELEKEDIVTLDWYVNFSWFVTNWGENIVSKAITDETGVNIRFQTPMGNEEEKLNALMASDRLPDLITLGYWEPQVEQMIQGDMVYPLNQLADQYDMYFYQVADKDAVSWYTYEDGNIYCYPNSSYTPDDLKSNDNIASNQTFLVRKDIYEAIGSPDMTTQEGFANAVRKAAEMFPEIDGKPLIPIGAHFFDGTGCVSFDQYLQNFLAVPYEKDGQYYNRNTDPQYISWLKLFRQLGEEGYLADDIFVDQRTQMSEKLEEGRYFCMLYQRTDIADQERTLYEKDPNSIYIAVDGPKNDAGDDPVLPTNDINGWTVTLISKNCKDPERAMKFLDYMLSEQGQKMICLGVEGVTYHMENGKPVLEDEVKQLLNSDRAAYDQKYGADDTYWMLQNNVMQLQWEPDLEEPLKQLEEWTYPYTSYQGMYTIHLSKGTSVENRYNKIKNLWGNTLPKLLLAPTEAEFDQILEEYCTEIDKLGYAEVVQEETRQMNENKNKMGM